MRYKEISLCLLILIAFGCKQKEYIKSQFSNIDTLSTNDWWNRSENPIVDLKVIRDDVVAFGIYTVSNKTLKLTAQLFPLYPDESREVRLEIYQHKSWKEIQRKKNNEIGWSTTFRVENWDDSKDIKYRLRHSDDAFFEGMVRKDPKNKNEIVISAF